MPHRSTKGSEMQDLYTPQKYPKPIRDKLATMPPLAIEIANRWMLGWPKIVKGLIDSGEYLEALMSQEERERDILTRDDLRHLARHEIAELYGLSPMPPTPSATT